MRHRSLWVAVLAAALACAGAVSAGETCASERARADSFGRLDLGRKVEARPDWAVDVVLDGAAVASFRDPEGVAYSLVDGHVVDKQVDAPGPLPWRLVRSDGRDDATRKLAALLPAAVIRTRSDRAAPTLYAALPHCPSVWIEVGLDETGVAWASINEQP